MSQQEAAVRDRYSAAAEAREAALCCPVDYDPRYLEIIPAEVIERDYGCGDPSKHLAPGEVVLDLGSGTGKICFIASQVVGATGRVIGVDVNDDMLAVARGARAEVAAAVGFDNVSFVKGRIQDLRFDRDGADEWLGAHPVRSEADLRAFEAYAAAARRDRPLIADDSVDVVVSNCVLNLVAEADKRQLFAEIHRVLKRGGRAVISDIVSDERVPEDMQKDPELWSGCISGAFQEADFLTAFEEAGFYGIEILERGDEPWQTVEGIEFRSVTVVAYKGKEGASYDYNEAVVYLGPFSEARDDDGQVYPRGQRVAVCRKTFKILTRAPYAAHFAAVSPIRPVACGKAPEFPSSGGVMLRHPRQTKGEDYALTEAGSSGCC